MQEVVTGTVSGGSLSGHFGPALDDELALGAVAALTHVDINSTSAVSTVGSVITSWLELEEKNCLDSLAKCDYSETACSSGGSD